MAVEMEMDSVKFYKDMAARVTQPEDVAWLEKIVEEEESHLTTLQLHKDVPETEG